MKITPEMMVEDEKRWHARDVITELGYCGNCMRDRKNMTNLDIRFCAYIMRKAHEMLKAREPRVMTLGEVLNASIVWLEPIFDLENDMPIWFEGWAEPVESSEYDIHLYCFGNETPAEAKYNQYGRTWRCWTSRPTPEQMRDTPWEGGK